jgi:hypothetical protein
MIRKSTIAILALAFPFCTNAHPGVGIVKDSKGNIYYSDLMQVWKISNGKRSVAVPDVHTHELYIDSADNLYGEGNMYRETGAIQFSHYLWVLRPTGKLDTVVGMREAYIREDFSLARDPAGNEYYTKQFLRQPDTTHIYKRTPGGAETILATGQFKGIIWLHPQHDGTVLYAQHNNIYRLDSNGNIKLLIGNIGNERPSFSFSASPTTWGLWQDAAGNVYAAVFSDQAVKKITPGGTVTEYYRSKDNYAPTHGVFDNNGQLWVLESSDKNEVRVVNAPMIINDSMDKTPSKILLSISILVIAMVILLILFSNKNATKV